MGFFSSDSSSGEWKKRPESESERIAREGLRGLAGNTINMPLRQTAGMSGAEQQGMGLLSSIASGGAFADPSTSMYYQGMRDELNREEQQGVNALRHRQSLGGAFQGGRGQGQEMDYRANMSGKRMSLLGSLYESERARDNPYTRLNAAMTYGSLPRSIEQQGYDSSYNQQMGNTLAPYQYQAPIYNTLLQDTPYYYEQGTYEPSTFSQIAGIAAPFVGGFSNAIGNLFSPGDNSMQSYPGGMQGLSNQYSNYLSQPVWY